MNARGGRQVKGCCCCGGGSGGVEGKERGLSAKHGSAPLRAIRGRCWRTGHGNRGLNIDAQLWWAGGERKKIITPKNEHTSSACGYSMSPGSMASLASRRVRIVEIVR